MLKQIILSLLFLIFSSNKLISQSISGKIVSSEDLTPVAFANIGISDSKYGTYSNVDGVFTINKEFIKDSSDVIIYAIGYEKNILPNELLSTEETLLVKLIPKVYEMEDIQVSAKRVRKVLIWSFAPGHKSTRIGRSVAILVNIPQEQLPIRIYKASVGIFANPFPEALFRVRFMSFNDKTELPDQDLTTENLITKFGKVDGWVTFNIDKNSQLINEDTFFIVFENLNLEMANYKESLSDSPYPLFMLKGFLLGKDKLLLSNAALNHWKEEKEDLVFNFQYSYEKQ